ncbi:MAG: hypothetical protein ACUVUQ_08045 [Thermodesulfovibrionales bacterium]
MWPLLVLAGLGGFGRGYSRAKREREERERELAERELEKKRGFASSLLELAGTGIYPTEKIPQLTKALGKVYGITDTGDIGYIEKLATGIAEIATTEKLAERLAKADEIIRTNISEGFYGSVDELRKDVPKIAMLTGAPIEEVSKIAESYITQATKTLPSLGLPEETPPTLEKEPYPSLGELREPPSLWAERLSLGEAPDTLKRWAERVSLKPEGLRTITEEELRTPLSQLELNVQAFRRVFGRDPTEIEKQRMAGIAPKMETKYLKEFGALVTIEDGKVTGIYRPSTPKEQIELDGVIKMIEKLPKDIQSKIKVSINPVTGIKNIEIEGTTFTLPAFARNIFTHASLFKYLKTGNMDVLVPKPEGQTPTEKADAKYYADWVKNQLKRIAALDPLRVQGPEEGDEEAYSNAQAGLNLIEEYKPSLSRKELLKWMDYFEEWFRETKGKISFHDYLMQKGVLPAPRGYTPQPTKPPTKQDRASEVSKILSGGEW